MSKYVFNDKKDEQTVSPELETDGAVKPWIVMVVDDDEEVHHITNLVLSEIVFENRPVKLLNAYSAREAKEMLRSEKEIAVILLDVVMETERSGLELAREIREELKNLAVRIILRTGQPGEAPSMKVIVAYDINDYKEKSELTASKLFSTVIASMRAYRQIVALEQCQRRTSRVLDAMVLFCKMQSTEEFAEKVLKQMESMMPESTHSVFLHSSPETEDSKQMTIIASTGDYSGLKGRGLSACAEVDFQPHLVEAIRHAKTYRAEEFGVFFVLSSSLGRSIIVIRGKKGLVQREFELLRLFTEKALATYNNLMGC